MQSFSGPGQPRVEVHPRRVVVIAGGRADVDVEVTHRGEAVADFDVAVVGVPPDWSAGAMPLIGLRPGERREVQVPVRVPAWPAGRPGAHKAAVRVVQRGLSDTGAEVPFDLVVAAFALEGRIGVLAESTRLTAVPGETLDLPFTVSNQGLVSDTFTTEIEGLPASWITSPTPQATLGPGEGSQLVFSLQPPRGPASQAGLRPFAIRVVSRESPEHAAILEGTLEIPEVHQFGAQLLPVQAMAGESAAIKVQNRGNAPARYLLTWESEGDALRFTPPGPTELLVRAGQTERVPFLPRTRRRPLFGGPVPRGYRVHVASESESHTAAGQVLVQGWLPAWLGTAALFAFILSALLYLLVRWAVAQPPVLTPTPALTAPAPVTPTIQPGVTPVG